MPSHTLSETAAPSPDTIADDHASCGDAAPLLVADILSAAIASMGDTLDMARLLVVAGRRIDLAGLDTEIGTLCAAVLARDREQARPLRAALEALLRRADDLAAALPMP